MKSIFAAFKHGLLKTKTSLMRSLSSLFSGEKAWTEDDYETLETSLISADLGLQVTDRIMSDIRKRYECGEIKTAADIVSIAQKDIFEQLSGEIPSINFNPDGPTIILMVGVNGSGKTTTSGKLAYQFKQEGKSVMLAACDTFRAAAVEQLKIWGERLNVPVISSHHGADAASVAFDAVSAAVSRKVDILIIDTAGRQHTKVGLMNELDKIRRTVNKACPSAPHESWLIVDGSTGTNALMQAREFGKVSALTGLCVTKLDGSAKGGVVVAIHNEMKYPIRFVGLGEKPDQLQAFDPEMFAKALFEL
ncbi:MAG: signal recognition particle-docking protein FtsY [Lentisphaeria bacterium]